MRELASDRGGRWRCIGGPARAAVRLMTSCPHAGALLRPSICCGRGSANGGRSSTGTPGSSTTTRFMSGEGSTSPSTAWTSRSARGLKTRVAHPAAGPDRLDRGRADRASPRDRAGVRGDRRTRGGDRRPLSRALTTTSASAGRLAAVSARASRRRARGGWREARAFTSPRRGEVAA